MIEMIVREENMKFSRSLFGFQLGERRAEVTEARATVEDELLGSPGINLQTARITAETEFVRAGAGDRSAGTPEACDVLMIFHEPPYLAGIFNSGNVFLPPPAGLGVALRTQIVLRSLPGGGGSEVGR